MPAHESTWHSITVTVGNTIYEQDLTVLGFPALLPYVQERNFTELHRQCLIFDKHLRRFLTEHSVDLNSFATVEELQTYLGNR